MVICSDLRWRVGERWLLTFIRTFIWIDFLWMFLEFYQPCVCVLSMWVVIGGSKLISVVTFLGRVVFGSCFGWVGWTGALWYICFEVFRICVWGDRDCDEVWLGFRSRLEYLLSSYFKFVFGCFRGLCLRGLWGVGGCGSPTIYVSQVARSRLAGALLVVGCAPKQPSKEVQVNNPCLCLNREMLIVSYQGYTLYM